MEMICLIFDVRIVSKSPTEFYPPIGAFMELRSNAILPCLVNLAHLLFTEITPIYFGLNSIVTESKINVWVVI